MAGIELAGGLRDLGLRVLDILRLVEHDHVIGVEAEFLDVAVEQGEGCQNDVRMGNRAVVFQAVRAAEHEHAEVRRELEGLRPPVRDDGGGGDDEHRRAARVAVLFLR